MLPLVFWEGKKERTETQCFHCIR